MKTNFFSVLLSLIRRTLGRSIAIFMTIFVIFLTILSLVSLEKNIFSALRYYEYSPLDEKRFTLMIESDIFSLFARGTRGIDADTIAALRSDDMIERISSYTLIEIPVLVRFTFFQFGLETDMPVFAVSDGSLSGATTPLGISQILVDFYNQEFAGSAPYFPRFTKEGIIGQDIDITFGKSKLFASLDKISAPLRGEIVAVDIDYPGFGLIIPESIARRELDAIGVGLDQPYKIVWYMKSAWDASRIALKYGDKYKLSFDQEDIKKLRKKTELVGKVVSFVGIFLFAIFFIILSFLFTGYFRERSDIYRMFFIFGMDRVRSRLLLFIEPVLLILWATMLAVAVFLATVYLIMDDISLALMHRGIDFPLQTIWYADMGYPIIWAMTVICLLILVLDSIVRRNIRR